MENEQNDGQLTDRLMVWFCHLIYGTSVAHSLLCQGYGASVARGVCVCHPLYSAPPERPLAAVSLLLEPMSWMIATPAWGQELIYSASLCSHLTLVKRFRLLGSTVLRRYHAMKRSVSQCDASLQLLVQRLVHLSTAAVALAACIFVYAAACLGLFS